MEILVLNCGSSSVKYHLFEMEAERDVAGGMVERIGQAVALASHRWEGGSARQGLEAPDHRAALLHVRQVLQERGGGVAAVGHRVVHGGERFVQAALITPQVEESIEECVSLAPLHNPPNLVGIRAARQFFPQVPHVAVFDTAFHQTMPARAFLYPLPYELYQEGRIRRYGFHGTSHRFVAGRAARMLGRQAEDFTGITCHLGNGCSLAAIERGRSLDTSMGLTPLEGVMMGTRSGDIDPAIVFHLAGSGGLSLAQVEQVLNRQSGLLGVSGVSNDLRQVQEAAAGGNGRAELALDLYAYRVRKYLGAYLAALGRAEAVVFTGGVGEHSGQMRRRILEPLAGLGLVLDPERNRDGFAGEREISTPQSPVRLLVIPTNEELVIARDTRDVLLSRAPQ
ncbi:MAG: acetate kinase [Candidatus Handelsmanbacteria bacterium]|nr:acetate kinase [Candidatus Handelsmanbacteria bacterium]